MSDGTIIVRHVGYAGITSSEVLDALTEEARRGDRRDVQVDLLAPVERAQRSHDWADVRRGTFALFRTSLKPALDEFPEHRIAYYGTVPIPVAMLLGLQVGTWRTVDIFLRHHVHKNWLWPRPAATAPNVNLDLGQLPNRPSPAEGDVIIRVSTSYAVDAAMSRAVVPNCLAEIDIRLDSVSPDALEGPAAVEAVAARFREALDAVQDRYPRARLIHIFASIPVGLAFRLGTVVSPSMHARIQTYELDRAGSPPGFYPAFQLQEVAAAIPQPTVEEAEVLAGERERWHQELMAIGVVASDLAATPQSWADDVAASAALVGGRWRHLPRLSTLRGVDTQIDLKTRVVSDGFMFDAPARCWRLDDIFLLSIIRRIPNENERRQAARLFLLHESVHDAQCLTRGTAAQVGRFAKVLEEADYQADVWALFYEYAISTTETDAPVRFRQMLHIAIETMMAFDEAAGNTDEMQLRRISRYLIWSWQVLALERAQTFEQCVELLVDKPVIEVAGLRLATVDGRIFCSLRADAGLTLELAVLCRTRLFRIASGPAARLDLVMKGLRDLQGSAVREPLRAIADTILGDEPSARRA